MKKDQAEAKAKAEEERKAAAAAKKKSTTKRTRKKANLQDFKEGMKKSVKEGEQTTDEVVRQFPPPGVKTDVQGASASPILGPAAIEAIQLACSLVAQDILIHTFNEAQLQLTQGDEEEG